MSLDRVASVQSRIAAIQERIVASSNQGRPPVAVTELGDENPASTGATGTANAVAKSTNSFASECIKQITSTEVGKSNLFHGRGVIQGQPGTAEIFVQRVKSYIGVLYMWGDMSPVKGLNRSGPVQTAACEVGVELPCMTYDRRHAGEEVDGTENARPGDLIICHKSGHVAVYISNNRMIHIPRPGENVIEASVKDMGPTGTIRRMACSENDPAPTVMTEPTAAATCQLAPTATLAPLEADVGFNPSGDLASTLADQFPRQNRVSGAYGGTRQGGVGTTSANAALLSQLVGTGAVTNSALNPLAGTTPDAMLSLGSTASTAALSTTARSLGAISALRSALGA